MVRRLAVIAFALVAQLGAIATPAWSHPLHTTLTELTRDKRDGSVRIVIRAFIDDFAAAAAARQGTTPGADHAVPDRLLAYYLSATLSLTGRDGRRLPLTWESSRRAGDVVWVTLRAPPTTTLAGLRLRNAILCERFEDQVNIVQVVDGAERRSVVFVKGEGEKRL